MTSPSPAQPKPLYLASTSPRRGDLLRAAGYIFEQCDPPFDDTGVTLDGASPTRGCEALAYLKATSVGDRLESGVVIGCDTVVVQGEHVFGKPTDEAEARAMLDRLIDDTHSVVSAVALVDAAEDRAELFHVTVKVALGPVPQTEVESYLASGMWSGKAGGYNLAELEQRWPFTVEGDPTTVVGLPIEAMGTRLAGYAAP